MLKKFGVFGAFTAACLFVAVFGFAAEEPAKAPVLTIEGEIVDLGCYTSRQAKGADHASCASRCMENSTPAGLLDSRGKVLTIAASSKAYSGFAAKWVRLTGPVRGHAMRPEKMAVKDGDQWREVPLKFGAPQDRS